MANRKQIIIGIVLILVVLNLARWWPADNNNEIKRWEEVNASQLRVYGTDVGHDTKITSKRDLFYLDIDIDIDKPDIVISEKPKLIPPPEKNPLKETEPKNNSETEFKLVGVLIKNSRFEAFLLKNNIAYNARINDLIENRYKVEGISLTDVTLRDTTKGRLNTIPLSGGSSQTENTNQSLMQ